MKTLELHFVTSAGKTARLTVEQPQEPVNPEEVKEAMQSIIDAGVFIDSEGNTYEEIKAARLVERTVTEYSLN
ncbi:DUF2922 domain-containing protein [Siminovitchia fortis]|uniref:DUF2922 domain-containing protein n=1 Tax=Siminovitchia fortis TaxID=254758 RepID=A0A443IUB4_9BACI|nr:DUF2922 domain-containing protein [Siminovitchia fortis]RWR11670.1 DUF2922 domain-containing protein [Siminovitchia fortis]WHY83201.1 DUF2922 domain-containing protein [Siminovitchia fortis]